MRRRTPPWTQSAVSSATLAETGRRAWFSDRARRLHLEFVSGWDLLLHCDSRSTDVFGSIPELWQAVVYSQHLFLVVHMHTGLKRQFRQDGRVNVGQTKFRMLCQNVATAGPTPLAVAFRCLVIRNNVVRAPCDFDCLRLPQGKGVHRPSGPMPA